MATTGHNCVQVKVFSSTNLKRDLPPDMPSRRSLMCLTCIGKRVGTVDHDAHRP